MNNIKKYLFFPLLFLLYFNCIQSQEKLTNTAKDSLLYEAAETQYLQDRKSVV